LTIISPTHTAMITVIEFTLLVNTEHSLLMKQISFFHDHHNLTNWPVALIPINPLVNIAAKNSQSCYIERYYAELLIIKTEVFNLTKKDAVDRDKVLTIVKLLVIILY